MSSPTYFLVAGGTDRQGGGVLDALLADKSSPVPPRNIYVLTRNLRQKAVFLAQAHGPTEVTDATGFIDTAVEYGVQYFVYSSVDRGGKINSDKNPPHCKTFSDKYKIEKHLEGHQPHVDFTILRPTWFADNAHWGFPGKLCMTGWRDNMKGKRMQVVTARDTGRWAMEALRRPDGTGLKNTAISVASDELTFAEVDAIFQEETGALVGVVSGLLARGMIWAVTDLRTMSEFIGGRDYGADLQELAMTVEPTSFRQWVRDNVKKQQQQQQP